MKKLIFLIAFLCSPIFAQVAPLIPPVQQFMDANGKPLAGGCLYSYDSGSANPHATYADSTGLVANSNPVLLDSAGRASIWLAAQAYRLVLYSAGGINCVSGSFVWSQDNVTSTNFLSYPGLSAQFSDATLGTLTVSSTTTLAGALHLMAPVTGLFTFSDPGLFLGGQSNYVTANVGGVDLANEYASLQGGTHAVEPLVGAVQIPSNATVHQANGIAGYCVSHANSNIGQTNNCVGAYSQARAAANTTGIWGSNQVAVDAVGLTGTFLIGDEIDVNVFGTPTAVYGLMINGLLQGTMPGAAAFMKVATPGPQQWPVGMQVDRGVVSGAGIDLSGTCYSGTCGSSWISLTGWTNATPSTASISADSKGNLSLTRAPSATGTLAVLSGSGACATHDTQVGGSWSGNVRCTSSTGASTLVITPGTTAPNGWSCSGSDNTSAHELAGAQSGGSATTCTLKFSSITQNDFVNFTANSF